MSKLHELLAVETDLKNQATNFINEAQKTFAAKTNHFIGQNRTYQPVNDDAERFPDENQELVTTVYEKLNFVEDHVGRYYDALVQKEFTNTFAKADLVIGDTVIATGLPATALLALENRFKALREVYRSIPTLDPAEKWTIDTQHKDCYVSETKETTKTAKVVKPLVLAQATDKHPAQVQMVNVDEIIGKWKTTRWCGMLTPAEKSALIERVETVLTAIKSARCRANDCEVQKINVAQKLFSYIRAK
jgi:hypothetical protein